MSKGILKIILIVFFICFIAILLYTKAEADTFTILQGDTSYVDIGKGHYDIIFDHTPHFDSGLYDPNTFANCNFGFSPNPCTGSIVPPNNPPPNDIPEPSTYLLFILALLMMCLVRNPKSVIKMLRM